MPVRLLRPEIITSDKVNALSWGAECCYRRLMSTVDDYGRYDGRPSVLRASLYPIALDRATEADIAGWLDECERAGLIGRYTADGKPYLVLFRLGAPRAKASKWPAPPAGMDADREQVNASANGCAQTPADVPYSGSGSGTGTGAGAAATGRQTTTPDIPSKIAQNVAKAFGRPT